VIPELVVDARANLGEGPVWDPDRSVLWWVDILAGLVHRFDSASGRDDFFAAGQLVGAVALGRDGRLFVLGRDSILRLDPETSEVEPIFAFDREDPPRRTNDAKPDPGGRLWLDRMALDHAPGLGSLDCLSPDLTLTTQVDGLAIPNGLGWSPDGRTMYFAESVSRTITAYDFDVATGSISAGRTFLRIGPELGLPSGAVPDGLTVDSEGHLWVAVWGGGCVLRVRPDGFVTTRIDFPVSQTTSCTFGGPDLTDLYVTTAREGFSAEDAAREPLAGGLFRVRPGVRGLAADRFGG
jgi:sugar lactone lactonase YvrE